MLCGASHNNALDISHDPSLDRLVRRTPILLFQAIGISQVDPDGSVEAKEALHHADSILLRVTGRLERFDCATNPEGFIPVPMGPS
jgi:hypothetical protein